MKAAWLISVTSFRQFLIAEMDNRKMSTREFARYAGVSHSILNKFVSAETIEESGYPSLDTLIRLSKATKVSLPTLVSLVVPNSERVDIDPQALVIAERWEQLPDDARRMVELLVSTAALKAINQEADE